MLQITFLLLSKFKSLDRNIIELIGVSSLKGVGFYGMNVRHSFSKHGAWQAEGSGFGSCACKNKGLW